MDSRLRGNDSAETSRPIALSPNRPPAPSASPPIAPRRPPPITPSPHRPIARSPRRPFTPSHPRPLAHSPPLVVRELCSRHDSSMFYVNFLCPLCNDVLKKIFNT